MLSEGFFEINCGKAELWLSPFLRCSNSKFWNPGRGPHPYLGMPRPLGVATGWAPPGPTVAEKASCQMGGFGRPLPRVNWGDLTRGRGRPGCPPPLGEAASGYPPVSPLYPLGPGSLLSFRSGGNGGLLDLGSGQRSAARPPLRVPRETRGEADRNYCPEVRRGGPPPLVGARLRADPSRPSS